MTVRAYDKDTYWNIDNTYVIADHYSYIIFERESCTWYEEPEVQTSWQEQQDLPTNWTNQPDIC